MQHSKKEQKKKEKCIANTNQHSADKLSLPYYISDNNYVFIISAI